MDVHIDIGQWIIIGGISLLGFGGKILVNTIREMREDVEKATGTMISIAAEHKEIQRRLNEHSARLFRMEERIGTKA